MKIKKKILIPLIIAASAILTVLATYIAHENSNVGITEYTVSSSRLPESFDGYRIAQISDLHCAEFGENNAVLISMLNKIKPDVIFITGDLIDLRRGKMSVGTDFAKSATTIAPTYFVSGNHENDNEDFDSIADTLTNSGVTVLRGKSTRLYKDDEYITLVGIDDSFVIKEKEDETPSKDIIKAELEKLPVVGEEYTVLLAHRPNLINLYAEKGYDLVFSGHAHGGQFRFPIVGGIYAPEQGLFPKYTDGVHTVGNTDIVISRGLGNATFPFRIGNNPEIVAVTLKTE